MKRKDIALAYLARILLWFPIPLFKKWGTSIIARILASIVVNSVNNYFKALDMMNGKLKDNPIWGMAWGLLAIGALMPAAIIYDYAKNVSGKKEGKV